MQDYTEICIFYAHFYAKSPFLCTRAARAPNFNASLPATRTGGSALHPGGSAQGALPLDPARGIMPLDPLFFIRMRRALGLRPQRSALFYIKHERASPSTPFLFRRRSHAPLSLVAIRAVSSPYAALRRSARLSRGCSSSRRENAEMFASLLVPTELSRSSLIFTPRGYKRTRAPHRRYSDCYTKCQSRHSSAPGSPGENL